MLVCETDSNFIKGSMEKPKFVRLWIREGSRFAFHIFITKIKMFKFCCLSLVK